jgi:hypothetical protein
MHSDVVPVKSEFFVCFFLWLVVFSCGWLFFLVVGCFFLCLLFFLVFVVFSCVCCFFLCLVVLVITPDIQSPISIQESKYQFRVDNQTMKR